MKKKVIFISKKIIAIVIIIMIAIIGIIVSGSQTVQTLSQNIGTKYKILVDVEESKMYVMENGTCIKIYTCAGGKPTTPSPIGTWTIISKGKWGEGFGGSWLGFNVPWGKFGIHGTTEIYSVGWCSSHGCIRMNNKEVAELYNYIPIGTKVTIIDGVYRDFGRGYRNLKSGMYGSDVKAIQFKLKEEGFFIGEPNGKFGKDTEKAIEKYCKKNGLYVRKTVDIEMQKKMFGELID